VPEFLQQQLEQVPEMVAVEKSQQRRRTSENDSKVKVAATALADLRPPVAEKPPSSVVVEAADPTQSNNKQEVAKNETMKVNAVGTEKATKSNYTV
jgi:hypothetical protein